MLIARIVYFDIETSCMLEKRHAQACSITKRCRKGELPKKEREKGGRGWEGEGGRKKVRKEKRKREEGGRLWPGREEMRERLEWYSRNVM